MLLPHARDLRRNGQCVKSSGWLLLLNGTQLGPLRLCSCFATTPRTHAQIGNKHCQDDPPECERGDHDAAYRVNQLDWFPRRSVQTWTWRPAAAYGLYKSRTESGQPPNGRRRTEDR